ncbi:MAG TPA: murein biosynthesis integral membrane protein MurJ [Kiritimatiellia bacterium]|nr:murein biosynthesis integral membrane protein MurJ [Kiritimatiellia bacterium]HRZ11027.1 murein biosynthesis integral membrane protein MurJ [Kiritimatiellia bacterium]HSA18600.1 murein biosynthesis integral membrane protein MurJ [Kiritimatiellia bacterium]
MTGTRKSAGIVGLAVVGSRVFGLVRELVFAAMFGAGKFLDAFLAAFQIPNLMRDLFAEGALSVAFTTTFTKAHAKEGDESAWGLLSLLLSSVILILGGVCILGIAASPLLVHVTNFGFHQVPGKFELTVQLTRVLFPFILFVSIAAVIMGALNARHIFGLPASASTVFNIVSIVLGVGLAYLFDPQPDWRHPQFGERALWGVSLGVLLGGVAQMAVQVPALWRLGYRFRWRVNFRDDKLRIVWRLMWPSVIAGAAVQVNVLVNGMFASEIDGARSWLNCAFRLMQFPIGVFGVAIATVTLPAVARHHARSDLAAFGSTVTSSLRLAVFLTLPAAVGLFALAEPIIRLIYQHGRFSAADTANTALALRAYAFGLTGYAAIKVLAPCFYALDRPRIPLRVSLLGIGVNLALNLLMVKVLGWGHVGLATTTAALAFINGTQLFIYLRRLVHPGSTGWFGFLAVVAAAAAACGFSAAAAHGRLLALLPAGLPGEILALCAAMAAAVAVYFVLTLALRLPESAEVWDLAWRMLRGKTARPAVSEGPTKNP